MYRLNLIPPEACFFQVLCGSWAKNGFPERDSSKCARARKAEKKQKDDFQFVKQTAQSYRDEY
jgi:hypothetical protein